MSKQNGDTARLHRIRKQNTARRFKTRELRAKLLEARNLPSANLLPPNAGAAATSAKAVRSQL